MLVNVSRIITNVWMEGFEANGCDPHMGKQKTYSVR